MYHRGTAFHADRAGETSLIVLFLNAHIVLENELSIHVSTFQAQNALSILSLTRSPNIHPHQS